MPHGQREHFLKIVGYAVFGEPGVLGESPIPSVVCHQLPGSHRDYERDRGSNSVPTINERVATIPFTIPLPALHEMSGRLPCGRADA